MSIRIGILGYGNLGRGVECAIRQNPDMELAAVFTRRDPKNVSILTEGAAVCHVSEAEEWKDRIDVMILCGGSATDLPEQTPEYAKLFNVVDSFDTHARIPEHFANVDKASKESGHIALISAGWDPGMFSLNRVYANAVLPGGTDYNHRFFQKKSRHSSTTARLSTATAGYPYVQRNSGMFTKFMPYQPTIKDSGRNSVVTTVSNFMVRFWAMSTCAWYSLLT